MVKMVLIYPIHYEELIFEATKKKMKLHKDRMTPLGFNCNICMGYLATVRGTGAILCLEEGAWGNRVANILNTISLNMESARSTSHNLDFDEAYYIPITKEHMAKLAELAGTQQRLE